LEGTWDEPGGSKIIFHDDETVTFFVGPVATVSGKATIDVSKSPHRIEIAEKGGAKTRLIYELAGETLRIASTGPANEYPERFSGTGSFSGGELVFEFTYQRTK
jgi:uncharacterized protein (TIGR03067 family)